MPVLMSNEPLAPDLELLSKLSQHAQRSSWDGDMPIETLAEQNMVTTLRCFVETGLLYWEEEKKKTPLSKG